MKCELKPLSVNKAWRGGPRYKTKDYIDYIEEMGYMLLKSPKYTGYVEVTYRFYLKQYKRSDVGNFEKTLSDVLVKWGIIEDDRFIKKMTLEKFESATDYLEFEIKPYETNNNNNAA